MKYETTVELTLGVVGSGVTVDVSAFGQTQHLTLSEITTITFSDQCLPGNNVLVVKFSGKTDNDTGQNEKAVTINEVKINGIVTTKAIELSKYVPEYPAQWASEQTNLRTELTGVDYLGWNGSWSITFSVPAFTWIHQVEHLGWIHPVG